jgi:hypothetical protein
MHHLAADGLLPVFFARMMKRDGRHWPGDREALQNGVRVVQDKERSLLRWFQRFLQVLAAPVLMP